MKKFLLSLVLVCSFINAQAQWFGEPNMNNYKRMCRIVPGFGMYGDSFYHPVYKERMATSFVSHVWISAKNIDDELLLAADMYVGTNQKEFYLGPLTTEGEKFEGATEYFNRVWEIYGHELKTVKEKFNNGNLLLGDLPKDIREWPAIGNPYFTLTDLEILSQDLAPFFDENEDGLYNPLDGDLPIHSEETAFENREDLWSPFMLNFQVYNDVGPHQLSKGEIVGVEIQQINYLLNCPSIDEVDQTIFTRYKVINKHGGVLKDFKLGFYEHPILSCGQPYTGYNKELKTIYNYSREIDIAPTSFSLEGFTRNIIFLNRNLKGFISFRHPAVGIPNPKLTIPLNDKEFDNLLSLNWKDSTRITYGGEGIDSLSEDYVNFMFTDFPTVNNGWNMLDQEPGWNFNLAVIDFGAASNRLQNGASVDFEIANHVIIEPDYPGFQVFDIWQEKVESLIYSYHDINENPKDYLDCFETLTSTQEFDQIDVLIYPNPADKILYIESDKNDINFQLYDAQGKFLDRIKNSEMENSIDLSSYAAGLYFLITEDAKANKISSQKFVITR